MVNQMARMTKAQREATEEAARVEQEKQLRAEYPTRLMKALSQATELQFVLSVVNDSFVVTYSPMKHTQRCSL